MHKDIGTTSNVYAHAQQPRLRQAVARLGLSKSRDEAFSA